MIEIMVIVDVSCILALVGLCPVLSFKCSPKVVTEPDHGITHYLLTFRDERPVSRV